MDEQKTVTGSDTIGVDAPGSEKPEAGLSEEIKGESELAKNEIHEVPDGPLVAGEALENLDPIAVAEPLNPWFSMWTKPRATMRQILDSKSQQHILLLAAVTGIGTMLDQASMKSIGDNWAGNPAFLAGILVAALTIGPIGGILRMYIASALLSWTGKWIGGQASYDEIKAAFAWSNVPLIWGLITWVIELGLFGAENFTSKTPVIDASIGLTAAFFAFALIDLTIGIWAIVVYLKALAEAQKFSAWKALGNTLLPFAVIAGPILVIALLIYLIG